MRHHKYAHPALILLPLLFLVTGCTQRPEDRLIDLGKCLKASKLINDSVLAAAALYELRDLTYEVEKKSPINPALLAMALNEKVNDEFYPAGSSTNTQYVASKAVSWANSSVCMELRKKAPTPVPIPAKLEMKTVPKINGNCSDPSEAIKAMGLVPKEIQLHGPVDSDAESVGCAYRQDPVEGTVVKPGSSVTYRVWWESQ